MQSWNESCNGIRPNNALMIKCIGEKPQLYGATLHIVFLFDTSKKKKDYYKSHSRSPSERKTPLLCATTLSPSVTLQKMIPVISTKTDIQRKGSLI